MDIFQIVALGLTAVFLIVIVKESRPEFAVQLSVLTGIIIFLALLGQIQAIVDVLTGLAQQAEINILYLDTILKIIGIAYIAEFGVQICRDAGQAAIASKLEFAAKILILVLAVPVLAAVMDALLQLIP